MLLTYKLVQLIEEHSRPLAAGLLERVKKSPFLQEYRNVPDAELTQRVQEIYSQLGEWLTNGREQDIANRYSEIGARRAAQGVPLSQLIWTIVLVKENLWEYLKRNAKAEDLYELSGAHEMLQLLEQFFDRAMYFGAVGYERKQQLDTER
jgi:hypothetical protein